MKEEEKKDGTIPAEASKVFELKKGCEEVVNFKDENNKLREKLYLLSRRLYSLEVRYKYFKNIFLLLQMEYNDALNGEKLSAIKAQRGIENMEEMYRQLQEAEQQDDEEEGEGGEENKQNGESNGQ